MKGPKQIVDIPIAGGVESKIYKALVQPGKMIQSSGVQFDRLGAVSMAPSFEFVSSIPGTTYTQGLISDGRRLSKVVTADDHDPVRISTMSVPSPDSVSGPEPVIGTDVAVWGDYAFVAVTQDPTSFHYPYIAKVDLLSGESEIFATTVGYAHNNSNTRVVVAGDYLYAFFIEPGNVLKYRCWGLSIGLEISGSPFTISSGASATLGVSCCADADETRKGQGYVWVAWLDAAQAPQITEVVTNTNTLKYSDATVAAVSAPGIEPSSHSSSLYSMAVCTTTNIMKGYCWDRISGLARSGTLITTTAAACTPIGAEFSNVFYWFTVRTPAYTPAPRVIIGGYISDSSNGSLTRNIWGATPSSRAFVREGAIYFWVRYTKAYYTAAPTEASTQQTEFLMRVDVSASTNVEFAYAVASSIEKEAMTVATDESYGATINPCSVSMHDDEYVYAPIAEPQSLLGLTQYGTARLVIADRSAPMKSAFVGERCVLTGGFAHEYDGNVFLESNFILYPEIVSVTPTTGGSLTPGTTYYIKAVYVHTDANGDRVLSAQSVTKTGTLGGGQTQLTVAVSKYCLGRRPFAIRVYLSTDNTNFYLSEESYLATQGVSSSVTTSIGCTVYDASRQLLYTVGGIIDNGPTRSIVDVVAHNNRFFGVTSDGVVVYSKKLVDGIGVEWSPEMLEHNLLADSGRHWQLAGMDGLLIAIGEESVQIMSGDGANDLGSNSTLTAPMKIGASNGLVDGSIAIPCGLGVWFQSRAGFELLLRSQEVDSNIGAAIGESIGSALVKCGSVSMAHDEILFGMSDNEIHVFNTMAAAWSTRLSSPLAGDHPGLGVDSDGSVFALDSDEDDLYASYASSPDYTDAQMVIETPWLRVGSIGGRQRLGFAVINGEWLSDMTLSVDTYYDFDETVVEQFSEDYEDTVSTPRSAGDPFVWRQHIGRRCSTVKFKITTEASDGAVDGACCRLFGFTIELAQKPNVLAASSSHER